MSVVTAFAAFAALNFVATSASAPPAAPAAQIPLYTAEQFFDTVQINAASFSADGTRLLVTSDESGVANVYALSLADGKRTPLTKSTNDRCFAVRYFPDDDRFLYTADQGGNELNHLYVSEVDGTVTDLTPGDKLKAGFAGFSADDKSFFLTSNERDPRFMDVYRCTVPAVKTEGDRRAAYARTLVFKNEGGYFPDQISPDGRWLCLDKVRNNSDSDVWIVELGKEGAQPKKLTPHEGDAQHGVADFAPDGKAVYLTSDAGGEFTRVWRHDFTSGKSDLAFAADWDVVNYSFTKSGKYLVTAINADARTELAVKDVATGAEVKLPEVPAGDVGNVIFSKDEKWIAVAVNGDTTPSDLYVLPIDGSGGKARRLTHSLTKAIHQKHLVEASVVRFKSFDGLEVPGILYRPHVASAQNKVPAIVLVHGGPGGQSRKGYSAQTQYLVNHGFAVFAVNNRGSSGYGRTFFHADDRKHGEDDLQDCIYGRKYLESQDWVDGGKVAIMGGSYGGYMVCAALTLQPTAFDAGVDLFGVTNWIRTLTSIPAWWEAQRESLYAELGDPAKDEERLRRISPLFHGDKIVRPLLVIQGENDPRVLKVESDEIVAAAKKNGAAVEYVVFPDEGHGFQVKKNRITAAETCRKFLAEHLKAPGS